jgi:hypothetical protein
MSYNSVLDTFFSYWYVNLGVLLVLLIIFYFIKRKYIFFYTSTSKFLSGVLFYAIIFLWIITFFLLNPMFLGYGHPAGVDGMMFADGKVYVVDYILTGGSKVSGPAEYTRAHILDAETGNKILRFPAGDHCGLYGVKGDSLIFYGNNLVNIFSASSGKLITKLNRKTLPDAYPELSSGIDHVMISYSDKMLELTTVDGNHFNLSLRTAELYPVKKNKERKEYTASKKIYVHNDNEIIIDDQPGGRVLMQLQGEGSNQEVKYLKGRNGNVISELKFVMGEFIAVSEQQKCFVVLSFETTKKIGFILNGVSLDEQDKLWELNQSELRPEDKNEYPLPVSWTLNNDSDILYFAMKDEVIAIEILTGNILWREKL